MIQARIECVQPLLDALLNRRNCVLQAVLDEGQAHVHKTVCQETISCRYRYATGPECALPLRA